MARLVVASFTVTISGQAPDYSIKAEGPRLLSDEPDPFHWNPSPELQAMLDDLQDISRPITLESLVAIGRALYQSVFSTEIAMGFGAARAHVTDERAVRLRLVVQPDELALLPWELMHDGRDFICLRSNVPIVRLEGELQKATQTAISGKLKILYAAASPVDMPPLDVVQPAEDIKKQLAEGSASKRIQFDILTDTTLAKLRTELLKDYHILCFAGHGDPENIYLQSPNDGVAEAVPILTLARDLEGKKTRLVFLAACETAAAAPALAYRTEVPAVVAMQYPVGDTDANRLTARFFETLAAYRPFDVAMAEARKAIMKDERVSRNVFAPRLYLQTEASNFFRPNRNWLAILFAIGFVFAAILACIGLNTAQENLKDFEASQLAVQGSQVLSSGGNPETAALLALRSLKIAYQPEADLVAQEAEDKIWTRAILRTPSMVTSVGCVTAACEQILVANGGEHPVQVVNLDGLRVDHAIDSATDIWGLAISPDGKTFAGIQYGKKTLGVWDIATGKQARVLAGGTGKEFQIAYSPDGSVIAAVEADEAKVWDAQTGEPLGSLAYDGMGTVNALAFSPDGAQLAVADNTTITLWDMNNGKQVWQSAALSQPSALAFNADGRLLAAGESNGKVELLDAADGFSIKVITAHQNAVLAVAFSPDSAFVATGSQDKTAVIWDVDTGEAIQRLVGHTDPVLSLTYGPEGRSLLTGSWDGAVRLWAVNPAPELHTLTGHTGPVNWAMFSPDATTIVTASSDSTMRLWDRQTGQPQYLLTGHTSGVGYAAFTPDGLRIVSQSGRDVVRTWNAETGEPEFTFGLPDLPIYWFDFGWQSDYLVTDMADSDHGVITAWDMRSGEEAASIAVDNQPIYATITNDGSVIFGAGEDGKARAWEAQTGKQLYEVSGYDGGINWLETSRDGAFALTISGDQTAQLWRIADGTLLHTFGDATDAITVARFSPNGKIIATGGPDRVARLWDASSGDLLQLLAGHFFPINSIDFSPDSQIIATGSGDKTARVWDVATGKELLTLKGHTEAVNLVAFSPDGQSLVTASADGTARTWNVTVKDNFTAFEGHANSIESFAFSPDGETMLTGADDQTARVWDANSGQQTRLLSGHTDSVWWAAFDPTGNKALTGSPDQSVKVWNAADGSLLDTWDIQNTSRWGIFTPDGNQIILAVPAIAIEVRNAGDGSLIKSLAYPAWAKAIWHSADGAFLYAVGTDNTLTQWDTESWEQTGQITYANPLLAVSPDVTVALTNDPGFASTTVYLVDAATGGDDKSLTLQGHSGEILNAVFSPDGTMVLTASLDHTAILWDVETGAIRRKYRLDGIATTLAFSPDGQQVFIGLEGGQIIRNWVSTDKLVEDLCHNHLLRDLTDAERQTYRVYDTFIYGPTCDNFGQ